jgi:hypothetical protein
VVKGVVFRQLELFSMILFMNCRNRNAEKRERGETLRVFSEAAAADCAAQMACIRN